MTDQQRDQEPADAPGHEKQRDASDISRTNPSEYDSAGNADNDGGTSGDYVGGQSGMNSELGGGVSRGEEAPPQEKRG